MYSRRLLFILGPLGRETPPVPLTASMKDRSPKRPKAAKANAHFRRNVACSLATVLLLGTALAWLLGYFALGKKSDLQVKESGNQVQDGNPEVPCLEPESRAPESGSVPLPEITPAHFRNAASTAGYVGSNACLECHRDEHISYLKTTHSRSLAEVDVAHEPASGEFPHDLSGRSYRIYREGETLKLQEYLQDLNGREVVLGDHAATYSPRLGQLCADVPGEGGRLSDRSPDVVVSTPQGLGDVGWL